MLYRPKPNEQGDNDRGGPRIEIFYAGTNPKIFNASM